MSKTFRSFLLVFAASIQILQFLNNSSGQSLDAHITLDVSSAPSVTVEGRFLDRVRTNPRNMVFLREYAGAADLADRITLNGLKNDSNAPVAFKRFIAGEYVAEAEFTRFEYRFSLSPKGRPAALAHISWLSGDRGILMLDDILPQSTKGEGRTARITLSLPDGWEITTAEAETAASVYAVDNIEKAVFVISKTGSSRQPLVANPTLKVTLLDQWHFSDADAAAMATSITLNYVGIFRGWPARKIQINLMRFPGNVPPGSWEADTRGATVTILSSDTPFKSQSLQRLHEQLRHEIFHLWIPNVLNLQGNYDWFYEGFALYLSLKTGVAANQIRFEDFLASMGQAYNIENTQTDRLSLIDASTNRWNGANTRVYAQGLIVAFLCDLALLQRRKGPMPVESLLRQIYRKHGPGSKAEDGGSAILAVLRSYPELGSIMETYIKGSDKIVWTSELLTAGIESVPDGAFVKLKVVSKPTKNQRDLLNRLGYNQWRSLSNSLK